MYLSKTEVIWGASVVTVTLAMRSKNVVNVSVTGAPAELIGAYELKGASYELGLAWYEHVCKELIMLANECRMPTHSISFNKRS